MKPPGGIKGLESQRCDDAYYQLDFVDLGSAILALADEENNVEAVVFDESGGDSGFVYRPHSCGRALPLWLVSIEIQVVASGEDSFQALLKMSNLVHVSLSREEPLDLDGLNRIDADTFPWFHWRLIHAAVRNGSTWVTSPTS